MRVNRCGIWSVILVSSCVTIALGNDNYNTGTRRNSRQGRQASRNFECRQEGYHADPHDCKLYYRCVDWGFGGALTKFSFECGPGTVFSKQRGDICTHPNDSGRSECGSSNNRHETNNVNFNNMIKPQWGQQSNSRPDSPDQPYGPSQGSPPGPSYVPSPGKPSKPSNGPTTITTVPPSKPSSQRPPQRPPQQPPHQGSNIQATGSTPSTSDNTARPAVGTQCRTEGFFGDPQDCSKFYRCVNEGTGSYRKYEFKCGEGTIWDSEIEGCNHVWAVKRTNCRWSKPSVPNQNGHNQQNGGPPQSPSRPPIGTSTPPTPLTTTEVPPHSGGGHEGYPGAIQTTYPSGNPPRPGGSTQVGHPPNQQVPQQVGTTSNKPQQTARPDSRPQGPGSSGLVRPTLDGWHLCTKEGFFGDAKDCRRYYRCVESGSRMLSYEFTCGDGTVWDDRIQSCNHKDAVPKCGSSGQHVSTGDQQPDKNGNGIGVGQHNGYGHGRPDDNNIQHGQDPSRPDDNNIQQGQYPSRPDDNNIQHGQYPSRPDDNNIHHGQNPNSGSVGNGYLPSSTSGTIKPSKGNEGFEHVEQTTTTSPQGVPSVGTTGPALGNSKCQTEGFFANPVDCRKFYRCVSVGSKLTKYEFECGEGTVWDTKIQSCNHKYAVPNCGGTNQGTGSEDQSPNGSGIGQSSGDGNKRPDDSNNEVGKEPHDSASSPQNSGASSGQPPNTSAATTEISKVTESSVTSGQTTTTIPTVWQTTTTESSSSPTGMSEQGGCTSEGFFPDPKDCSKFYRCVNSGSTLTKYQFTCGEGTVWDETITSCNHKYAVPKCGGAGHGTGSENKGPDGTSNGARPDSNHESSTVVSTSTSGQPLNPTTWTTESPKVPQVSTNPSAGSIATTTPWKAENPPATTLPGEPLNPTTGTTESPKVPQVSTNPNAGSTATTTPWKADNPPATTPAASSETGTSESPSSEGSSSKGGCSKEGFFPDPKNCKKFYRCVGGEGSKLTRFDFTCGEGTAWDDKIQTCNHAYAVPRCGGAPGGGEGQSPDENTPESSTKPGPRPEITTISSGPTTTESSTTSAGESQKPAPTKPAPSGTTESTTVIDESGGSVSTPGPSSETPGGGSVSTTQSSTESSESAPTEASSTTEPPSSTWSGEKETSTVSTESGTTIASSTTELPSTTWSGEKETSTESSQSGTTAASSTTEPSSSTTEPPSTTWSSEKETSTESTESGTTKASSTTESPSTTWSGEKVTSTESPQSGTTQASSTTEPSSSTTEPPSTTWSGEKETSTESAESGTTKATSTTKPTSSTSSGGTSSRPPTTTTPKAPPSTTGSNSNVSTGKKGKCTDEGFFANANDCHKFYRCVDRGSGKYEKFEFSCGPGTAWDQSLLTCNHIYLVRSCEDNGSNENVDDKGKDGTSTYAPGHPTTSKSSTESSSETSSKPTSESSWSSPESTSESSSGSNSNGSAGNKKKCTNEGFFANDNDCHKFYRCVDRGYGNFEKFEFSCGPGTAWDQSLLTCNHIYLVRSCKDDGSNEIDDNSSTSGSSTESASHSSSGTTSESSSGSWQSSTESSSGSSTSDKPSGNPTTDKSKPTGIVCKEAGFYAHPTRCDKFYRCVDNGNGFSVYHFDCAPGTIFDPSISVCNHPESVYPARDCQGGGVTKPCGTTESSEHSSIKPTSTEPTTSTDKHERPSTSTLPGATTEPTRPGTTTEKVGDSTTAITTEASGEWTTGSTTETTGEASTQVTTTNSGESTPGITTESTSESTEGAPSTEWTKPTDSSPESTTPSGSGQTTVSSESTTQKLPPGAAPCPIGNLTGEQIVLVCPTGFKRHPKYCNLFYQCVSEQMDVKILSFSCPENTIFDEAKVQCLPEKESSQPCTGVKASERFYRRIETEHSSLIRVEKRETLCPGVGHYPYHEGCSNVFYKCEKNSRGVLQGYLYRCAGDFFYWSKSRRCERKSDLPMCATGPSSLEDPLENDTFRSSWTLPVDHTNTDLSGGLSVFGFSLLRKR